MNYRVAAQSEPAHRQVGLSDEQAVEMYKYMTLARKYDERALLLQRAGKVNFHISGIGQETTQVAAAMAMHVGKDMFLPYYRDYGMVLVLGMTVKDLMLSLFAKAEDPNSGGRQMPGHFGSKRLNIVTGSSPVTTQVPHAVGVALAAKMRGEKSVSLVTFGEGSSNQGDFHEGLNFAGVHKLPVIFLCENNQYAISVPLKKQVAGENVAARAQGYGFPGIRVDGTNPIAVYKAVKEARERAVNGEGPTLIEAVMYRLTPHSTSDDDLAYRSKEEVEHYKQKDGYVRFQKYLMEHGLWDEQKEAALLEEVSAEIREAVRYAEQAPYPKPEETLLHVYGDQQVQA